MANPIIYLMMLFRLIDGTAKNNGQRLDNVNQNYLVLATGKLELQKSFALGLIFILPQLHIPYVSLETNISLDWKTRVRIPTGRDFFLLKWPQYPQSKLKSSWTGITENAERRIQHNCTTLQIVHRVPNVKNKSEAL